MANTTLILGESGTGKSTSIRNLNPDETFILAILDKPLPFKGASKLYTRVPLGDKPVNYFTSDNYQLIIKSIERISANRPDIKTLVLDDWQYIMGNEYMRRASETGFTKFTEIGQHAFDVINALVKARADLNCFVLCHSDKDPDGKARCKTIGRMLDEKITIEGMFTTVMHSLIVDGEYRFITQGDSTVLAKSPLGMFEDKYIPNDLAYVIEKMSDYYNGEIKED